MQITDSVLCRILSCVLSLTLVEDCHSDCKAWSCQPSQGPLHPDSSKTFLVTGDTCAGYLTSVHQVQLFPASGHSEDYISVGWGRVALVSGL